jgi:hypothetical protein
MKKSSRYSSSWERLALALFALQLLLSGYGLYRAFQASGLAGGRLVGTITYKLRQAERKPTGQVLWNSLAQDGPVFNLDTIRTAGSSSATIHLEDGTRIELGEDSLLVLDIEAKRLGLSGGSLRITRGSGTEGTLEVRAASGKLSLGSGAAAAVSDKAGSLDVALARGEAKLEPSGEGPVHALSGGEALRLSPDGSVSEASVEPSAPPNGEQLVSLGAPVPVDFSWIGPADYRGRLVLAGDPGFSRISASREVSGGAARMELGQGVWYWRLENGSRASRAMRLDLVPSSAPTLVKPSPSELLEFAGEEKPLVDLAWTASPRASSYLVELDRDPGFGKTALELRCDRNALSTDRLEPGDWYCRVTALFPAGAAQAVSTTSSFRLARSLGEAPRWRGTQDAAVEVSRIGAKEGALRLSWDPVEGADSYRVAIARDEGLHEVVARSESGGNSTAIAADLPEGKYYVAVRATAGGREGPPSPPRLLVVTKPYAIKPVSPARGADLAPEERELDFSWRDPNGLKRYKVELSADADFSSVSWSAEAPRTQTRIRVPEYVAGELHWRVIALDEGGGTLLSSAPSSFNLPALLPSPVAISPRDGETIDAFERPGFAFAWKPSAGATEYRLSLFRATASAMIGLRDWRVSGTSVAVESMEFLAPDAYAWQLTAIRKGGTGEPEVSGRSATVVSYFTITQSSPVGSADSILVSTPGESADLPADFRPRGLIYVH